MIHTTRTSILLALLTVGSLIAGNAQKWHPIENHDLSKRDLTRDIIPEKYDVFSVDYDAIEATLSKAPQRFTESGLGEILIQIPTTNNKMVTFSMERSDVFHPDLAARYPEIRSYTGTGVTDPGATLKLSISHKGLAGMILSGKSTIYIDTYAKETKGTYIVYDRKDFHKHLADNDGQCAVVDDREQTIIDGALRFGDCQLRKYRLALACTGEYGSFHGGTVPDVLAEYNASMTRVNGIYEKDFGITMELIANTDQLIYFDSNTDPYTNNSGSTMLGQNQTNIDDIIGFDNYDIGHVYSTGGGGIASLRSPCTNRKARGVTGLPSPTGDPFWVDYVSHEMGHQFGGNHTYNNSCSNNRNDGTAFEPGSGTTIMSYAGICSPDVENRADDYFHTITLNEVANFVVAGAGSCGEIIDIVNSAPEIISISQNGLTIPASTPFELKAVVEDADGDAVTYCWEQMDNEIMSMPPSTNAAGGPMFRTYPPTPAPSRLFPRINSILNGANGNTWERLPEVTRELNFTLSVRDNHAGLGCTANDDVQIQVTDLAGPFLVTSQNTTSTWSAGESEIVTWDVANTDMAPVSCGLVDIVLSIDGGATFDVILAENIQNDGSEEINVPFQFSDNCRVMVKCATNIFFDVNDSDFTILAPYSIVISPSINSVCADMDAVYGIDVTIFDDDPTEITFAVDGLPAGITAVFSEPTTMSDGIVTLTLSDLAIIDAGSYPFTILSSTDMLSESQDVVLVIAPSDIPTIQYLSPADGQLGVSSSPVLSWSPIEGVQTYDVQLSTNPNFEDIIFEVQTTSAFTFPPSLDSREVYYWRVRGVSDCFSPTYQEVRSFQIGGKSCDAITVEPDLPIGPGEDVVATSIITLTESIPVESLIISIDVSHAYVGDLSATFSSPDGTTVQLFDRPGVPASNFGCSGTDILISLSDDAANSADILESTCDGTPAIVGSYQPIEALSIYNGILAAGDWTLIVRDAVTPDAGTLNSWTLENCVTQVIAPAIIVNNATLLLTNTDIGGISGNLLSVENGDPATTIYTLRSTPDLGVVQRQEPDLSWSELAIGDRFTQSDIDADLVRYQLSIIENTSDQFLFDVEDDLDRYLSNQVFMITSVAEGLSASGTITSTINCFGDQTGEITVTAQGGIAPYSYTIDGENFVPDNVFAGLPSGSYMITVRDSNGEEFTTSTVNMGQPPVITIGTEVTGNELTANASGGSGALLYSIDNLDFSAVNVFDLINGQTYRVYVQDENGCTVATEPETHYHINDIDFSVTDNLCFGLENGQIEILSVDGGLPPYSYDILGFPTNSSGIFEDLPNGSYVLFVTDSLLNTAGQFMIDVTSPPIIELNVTVVEDTIFYMATGGAGDFTYSLDDVTYEDVSFFVVPNGSYFVYARDANDCIIRSEAIVISTSTSDPAISDVTIYPNPADQYIEVSAPTNLPFEYRITDLTGRLLSRGAHQTNLPLMVDGLADGLYIITIKTDRGQTSERFVIGR